MSRARLHGALGRDGVGARAALVLCVATCSSLLAASCGVFDLGDVVTENSEGSIGDASNDSGSSDASTDGPGPCVPGGDPCNCLETPFVVSPPPNGNGEAILIVGDSVYFMTATGSNNPVVYRAPVVGTDGGTPDQVTVEDPVAPTMVAGGGFLFFRHTATPVGIARAPLAGSDFAPTNYFAPTAATPKDIAIDSTMLFFGSISGSVCGIPFDDAGTANADAGACGGQAPIVPPKDGGPSTFQIAASETDVFLEYNSKIYRASQQDGVIKQVVLQGSLNLSNVVENAGHLFWAGGVQDAGSVWSALDDGGGLIAISSLALEGKVDPPTIAVDGDGVYWSQTAYPKIWGADRDGSNLRLLACDPGGVPAIATDANYLYWVGNDGAVRRVSKR